MKKALVVYGTKSGCSAGVAQRIGKTLAATGLEVQIAPAESAGKAADYHAVIVGSGVRMGQWHESTRAWVAANAEALRANPPAFFTVGMTLASEPNATDKVRAFTDTLLAETGVKPVDIGVFAGWNTGEGFSLVERAILGAMKTPKGDFRDWAAIEAWTDHVAPQLQVS
jgi:menaquinone-dependent protoporphyrinogen oxidase